MQFTVFKVLAHDAIMFPVWWYARGLMLMLRWCATAIKDYAQYFAINIWIKNILVPMFGQSDWQSRLISIFMRSVQIVGRTFALVLVLLVIALALAVYIVAPIFLALQFAYHVVGSLAYAS